MKVYLKTGKGEFSALFPRDGTRELFEVSAGHFSVGRYDGQTVGYSEVEVPDNVVWPLFRNLDQLRHTSQGHPAYPKHAERLLGHVRSVLHPHLDNV